MTLHILLVAGVMAVALVGADANAQTTTQVPLASATVPTDVPVRALIAAMQVQDAAAIRTQFAPTATQAYDTGGKMKAPAAFAKRLESNIMKRHGQVTDPEFNVNWPGYNATGYTSKTQLSFCCRERADHLLAYAFLIQYHRPIQAGKHSDQFHRQWF